MASRGGLIVVCFALVIVGAKCDLISRIVGGASATIANHPYMVSIAYDGEHVCGGSLISQRWILTAAHCVYDKTTKLFSIRVGSTYSGSGGTLITAISQVITHEYYDEDDFDYDVALIQLTSTLTLSTTIGTLTLPSETYTIADGTSCTVAGWGLTSSGGIMSTSLLSLTVPIVNQQTCSNTYIYFNTVTSRMICAGYTTGAKDTCQGDSGGPLVYKGTQVGIVSWGADCATAGYPGVYTRVSAIRAWITLRTTI